MEIFAKRYNIGLDAAYFLAYMAQSDLVDAYVQSAVDILKPRSVLDVGCAKGYLVYLLDQLGIDAYGVDISSYAIAQAPLKIAHRLYHLDAVEDKFPFGDSQFDLITALEVFEHLDCFDNLLKEVSRALSPCGYLLITTPTLLGKYLFVDNTHISVKSRNSWQKLLKRYGLVLADKKCRYLFRKKFMLEFKRALPNIPSSTAITRFLMKCGKIGKAIRNNVVPYIDSFSLLRADEILLFKKAGA